jgi:hypothetical protein
VRVGVVRWHSVGSWASVLEHVRVHAWTARKEFRAWFRV